LECLACCIKATGFSLVDNLADLSYNRVIVNKELKMMKFDQRVSRKVTAEVLDLAEQGVIDWESLARDCLAWMSEDEVAQFAQHNGYIVDDEDA